jgi:outer membrane receptor protein involved in Fe transport
VLEVGDVLNPLEREIGASRNRAFGTLSYGLGDWGLTLRGTYTGPAYLDNQFIEQFGIEAYDPLAKVDAEFYLDMQMRFTPGDNYEFYIGVDNVLDNDPPIISGLAGSNSGTETDAGTYDAIGRRFYAGATLKF